MKAWGQFRADSDQLVAPEFVADYNARFAKAPHNPFDACRLVLPSEVLDEDDERTAPQGPAAKAWAPGLVETLAARLTLYGKY